jgi:D-alanyl-D-alanine carboxypeptidase
VIKFPATDAYALRILTMLQELGILAEVISTRHLVLHREPQSLVLAHTSDTGRELLLTQETASAWLAMQYQAFADGVPLALVSAFRSVERQREIIQNKLASGMSIETILKSVAPPGYSEHHTGRAVDIGTSEVDALEEEFETTASFEWLARNALDFGFRMSYPRKNPYGFVYEPWHWCWNIPAERLRT